MVQLEHSQLEVLLIDKRTSLSQSGMVEGMIRQAQEWF